MGSLSSIMNNLNSNTYNNNLLVYKMLNPTLSPTSVPTTQNTNTSVGPTDAGNLLDIDQTEIGLVPHMTGTIKGAGLTQSITETEIIKMGLVKIEMIPMQIHFVGTSFMLYKLEPAKKSDSPPPRLIIYTYPNEISVEESFGNQLQSSFFESLVRPLEKIGQLTQLGFKVAEEGGNVFKDILTGGLGAFADATGVLSGALKNDILGAQGTLGEAVSTYLQGSRIMWPKIWADSNMVVNYTIPIYLFCNNMLNDNEYKTSIVDPLQYLLQYSLPRSTGGGTYNWPWMVYAVAPGLFVLPEGIVSNITIDKYDIGFNNRPATVKVTITLTTLREVMPQDGMSKGVNNIPTVALNLNTYLDNFKLNKNSANIPIWESSTPTASTSVPLSSSGSNEPILNTSQITTSYGPIINNTINSLQNKNSNLTPQLVACIIQQESNGRPDIVSDKGAVGLMQLEPATAGISASKLKDPVTNINAGVTLLNNLLTQYNGNVSYALSAYNSGSGNVAKYGGVPSFCENYVSNITNCTGPSTSSVIPSF